MSMETLAERLVGRPAGGELIKGHQLERSILGCERCSSARAFLYWRHRRHCRQSGFLIWICSMMMGFIQSFTHAEIAGLFPNKSGGASVYGAAAWVRYSKIIAPLSVWCNWVAWTPVLSLGCSIAAAYILNALAPIPAADAPQVARVDQDACRSHRVGLTACCRMARRQRGQDRRRTLSMPSCPRTPLRL